MNESSLEYKSPAEVNEIFSYNDRFLAITYSASAAGILVFLFNLLRIGGNRFVHGLNGLTALLTAALLTLLAVQIYRRLHAVPRASWIWMAFAIGVGFWAVLELIRFVSIVVSPAPRLTLLNWLALLGYAPLFYALALRYTALETYPSPRQQQMLWAGLAVGLAYLALFRLPPVLNGQVLHPAGCHCRAAARPGRFGAAVLSGQHRPGAVESLRRPLALPRPGGDGQISGRFGLRLPGQLRAGLSGLVCQLLSLRLVRTGGLGLFVYETALAHQFEPPAPPLKPQEIAPNASALLFTDENDIVIKTSLNFRYLTRLPDSIPLTGAPASAVLGLSESAFQELKTQLRKHGSLKKYVIEPSYFRAGSKAWVTAIPSFDQQRRYTGMDMVVQVLTEGVAGAGLTNEERAMVENIFYLSGSTGEDVEDLLITYFNLHYRMLAGLAMQYEGSRRAGGLSNRVNQVAREQRLLVRVLEQELNVPEGVSVDELGRSVSLLLAAGREYITDLAGADIVLQETERLHREADRTTRSLMKNTTSGA